MRYLLSGRIEAAGHFGVNKLTFDGWLRHGRKPVALTPGRYRASFVAVDRDGLRSKTARLGFEVVR